jgi:hypothetical protein
MKRLITVILATLAIGLALMAGCTGKNGATGPEGVNGVNGKDANANCIECHNNSQLIVSKQREWEQSKHGLIDAGNSFDYAGTRSSCQPCHNGAIFPLWVKGDHDTASFYTLGLYNNNGNPNCRTCHSIHVKYDTTDWALTTVVPVKLLLDSTVTADFGKGNICINCHQARTNEAANVAAAVDSYTVTSTHWGPHHGPQVIVNMALGGYEDASTGLAKPTTNTHYPRVTDGCVQCHASKENYQDHRYLPVAATCNDANCHGAGGVVRKDIVIKDSTSIGVYYDTTRFLVDSVQVFVNRLAHELRDTLVLRGACTNDAAAALRVSPVAAKMPKATAGAVFNLMYVLEDKSKGIHNGPYELYLLVNSLKALGVSRDLTKYYQ